jgi:protein-S-isoprenylcysteine O-methyltransferase Ste14
MQQVTDTERSPREAARAVLREEWRFRMKRALAFAYGLLSYVVFLAAFLYAIGFVAGFLVPKTIDTGVSGATLLAIAIDAGLLGLFAIQHTVMARRGFKQLLTRVVPRSVERSTFVLASSLVLLLLFWQWRPLPSPVWRVDDSVGAGLLWVLCALGWGTVLFGTFMINHAHLFGLSQVWAWLRGREAPEPRFQTLWLYRYVRHPLMVGFIVAFWATPLMSAGHLLFAAAATGYIIIGTLVFEERDLERYLGEPYRRYRREVPAFIPRPGHVAEAVGPEGERAVS